MKKISDKLNINDSTIVQINANFESNNKGDFKELTKTLKIPRNKLILYTSKLKECTNEYTNCKNCKNILECKNKIEGYRYTPIENDENLYFEYLICDYKNKLEQETSYQKNIYYNSIPNKIIQARFKDLYLDDKNRLSTIKWCKDFIKNYKKGNKGLFLTGNFGSGKTYIISATIAELAKRNIKCAIVFWPDFINELKSSFYQDFEEKYELVKTVEILFIDDIGAENITEWSRDEVLCPLLQYRMDNNLSTFFTSNLTYEQLESHFSKSKSKDDPVKARRIIERIKQLTEYKELISKNLR